MSLVTKVIDSGYNWVNERAPGATAWWNRHAAQYYAPKNFNFWYYFGSLALLVFVNQIVTGIWLTMNFRPTAADAFDSVEYIMRDVEWGWIIRYMHSTGASLFFIVVYLHMFRGLIYGSYKKPRELIWLLGVVIFLALMAEAFLGYVLPWGQMSYWGAQVITSLFGAVPVVGEQLVEFIRGDYLISEATLNRFFALHVVALPFVLAGLIYLHLMALHEVGSNNPDGVEIKKVKGKDGKPLDGIPFHPYYTVKDLFGASFFIMIAAFIIFFAPTMGGWFLEHDNFTAANPMVTPAHIKPVWYFTPYYAMLRAIPDKLLGVIVMGGATLIFFLLPWLDRSEVKSIRYRGPITKIMITLFVIAFVILGWLGTRSGAESWEKPLALGLTIYYFAFFFTMPIWSKIDKTKKVPDRVTFEH
ncbi:cytochrome b [Ahniella affigens]|uniref:Cytochrome b n=1 Tax=Ahniella affigens TaxID=2021234 RepID=A0A2P1PTN1_9GAMM|nr:cytochrome b N-terminal domain-containing protein [Ahniella affigens]AVP98198.1 cytochrome b [Ahniella affigens]